MPPSDNLLLTTYGALGSDRARRADLQADLGKLDWLARGAAHNELVNGGFERWRRGTGPYTVAGVYAADLWRLYIESAGTLSVALESATVDAGSPTSAKLVYAHSGVAGEHAGIEQPVEHWPQFKGRAVAMSARVKCSVPNAARIALWGGVGNFAQSAFHPGDGTWQTLRCSLALTDAITWLLARLDLAASATAYFDNCVLAHGTVAPLYRPRPDAIEDVLCDRRFEIQGSELAVAEGAYAVGAGRFVHTPFGFRAIKPVTPTVTVLGGVWTLENCVGEPVVNHPTPWGYRLMVQSAAAGQLSAFCNAGTLAAATTAEANL